MMPRTGIANMPPSALVATQQEYGICLCSAPVTAAQCVPTLAGGVGIEPGDERTLALAYLEKLCTLQVQIIHAIECMHASLIEGYRPFEGGQASGSDIKLTDFIGLASDVKAIGGMIVGIGDMIGGVDGLITIIGGIGGILTKGVVVPMAKLIGGLVAFISSPTGLVLLAAAAAALCAKAIHEHETMQRTEGWAEMAAGVDDIYSAGFSINNNPSATKSNMPKQSVRGVEIPRPLQNTWEVQTALVDETGLTGFGSGNPQWLPTVVVRRGKDVLNQQSDSTLRKSETFQPLQRNASIRFPAPTPTLPVQMPMAGLPGAGGEWTSSAWPAYIPGMSEGCCCSQSCSDTVVEALTEALAQLEVKASPPQVTVTGNVFEVKKESDIDRIAAELARRLSEAQMVS